VDADVENAYYNAKGLIDSSNSSVEEAAHAFEEVIRMERETLEGNNSSSLYGQWTYKAMKQLVKLYLRDDDSQKMLEAYKNLLECIASETVTQNAVEKGVNGLLERVSSSGQKQLSKEFYDSTLNAFRPKGPFPNERLWFKTNLKLGQLLYEINDTSKLQKIIQDLLQGVEQEDGTTKEERYVGTHLMEIYALQIQLYSRIKDNKKLRQVFEKAMRIEGSIPHPRTLALIQELGGKMHMASREFRAAGKTFFQAFKSYDEAGDPSRLRCLKYLVMASMLHASSINPFDSQEARPYKDDPEILVMTNLVQAFHANDIKQFEGILRRNEGKIMDDEFVREHLADLLRTIRTQVLKLLISPYTRISLDFIAKELNNIPVEDVESLLVSLILDNELEGKIDQVQGILTKSITTGTAYPTGANASFSEIMPGSDSLTSRNCAALCELTSALDNLNVAVTSFGGKSIFHQIGFDYMKK